MSLLMQALKKAESAKQKQSAAAEPEASAEMTTSDTIGLSPKEPVASKTVSDSGNAPAARSTVALDMMDMELTPVISKHDAPAVTEANVTEQEFSPAPLAEPVLASSNIEQSPHASDISPAANVAIAPSAAKPDARAEYASQPEKEFKAVAQQQVEAPPAHAKAATAAATPAIPQPSTAQLKAKAVFASKQPSGNRRAIVMATIGFVTVAAVAGSGYYYLQTMSQGSTVFANVPQQPSTPQTVSAAQIPAQVPAQIPASDTAAIPTEGPALTQAANSAAPVSASAIVGAVAVPTRAEQEPARAAPVNVPSGAQANTSPKLPAVSASASTSTSPAASMPAARSTPASTPQQAHATIATDAKAIQVRKTNTDNQINPTLSNAYQLLITGDAEAAHQQYQKVLQLEPNNRDALLGMASISLSRKQTSQAGGYYLRLLELDPADPDAIAGLTSLQSGDASQNESRLKKILTQNPQAGSILFVLGNLYAQQSRWPDAQQAYFRAYGTAPGNADYAFNLAVSLDKLNQGKLALDFYQRALTLVNTSPGNFNRTAVEDRIAKLRAAGN